MDTENTLSIGKRIKKIRLLMDLSQEEFGQLLGVTGHSVGKYEKGINLPPADILSKIASEGKTTVDWLIGKMDDRDDLIFRKYRELSEDDQIKIREIIRKYSGEA